MICAQGKKDAGSVLHLFTEHDQLKKKKKKSSMSKMSANPSQIDTQKPRVTQSPSLSFCHHMLT